MYNVILLYCLNKNVDLEIVICITIIYNIIYCYSYDLIVYESNNLLHFSNNVPNWARGGGARNGVRW